ncbi:MAG: DNA-binding transcriptional MerR regulator [Myxococcota bacterium]|jgi:DNA-binding transcriptional MerR regulator
MNAAWTHPTPVEEPPMTEPQEPATDNLVAELAEPMPAPEYSIDTLAAHTGVPSRTIRFYQSKGALQKPEIRGRKAVYIDAHVERLELIGLLQDRGLRIRAIRDLVSRFEEGELVLSEWLGLQDTLVAPWSSDGARLVSEAELGKLTGPLAPGKLSELVRLKLIERKEDQFLVINPQRLQTLMQLEGQGVAVSVSAAALDRSRRHTAKLAKELASIFETHAGQGFGGKEPAELNEAIEAWRAQGPGLVAGVFAEEMRRVLLDLMASGTPSKLRG